MTDELKPCPFCGCKEIARSKFFHDDPPEVEKIYCASCHAEVRRPDRWNTRPREEELEKALRMGKDAEAVK